LEAHARYQLENRARENRFSFLCCALLADAVCLENSRESREKGKKIFILCCELLLMVPN